MLDKNIFLLTRFNVKNLHISRFIATFAVGITEKAYPEEVGLQNSIKKEISRN